MPEFCAPALGNKNNTVTVEADLPADASGVLYALGGFAGGLTCFIDDGYLCYEYNLFIISRTKIRSDGNCRRPATIAVETRYAEAAARGTPRHHIRVGQCRRAASVPISAPLLFTANDCLDIGVCLGSTGVARILRQGTLPLRRSDRSRPREIHDLTTPERP